MAAGMAAADPVPVAAKVPLSPSLTFGFDVSAEYYATSKAGAYSEGDYADTVLKVSLSQALPNDFSLTGSLSQTFRVPDINGIATTSNQLEAVLGYRWRLSSEVAIPLSATLGYSFGEEPRVDPNNPTAAETYYAFNVGADWKVSDDLTWNVINVRYRNAFNVTWLTPKVTTGFNYRVNPTTAIYGNVGESWKDSGSGYNPDKYNLTLGVKLVF